jgi:3-hydroxyacyl-[acyl-carrier-protein] dehydratase
VNKPLYSLLPHRPPFLFVDTIHSVDKHGCLAEYTFKADSAFFAGHFPDYPVVPGVLLIEAMAQCGGAAVVYGNLASSKTILLATVKKAKFRRPVLPDEKIDFQIKFLKTTERLLHQSGKAIVDGEVATEAEWICMTVPDQTAKA